MLNSQNVAVYNQHTSNKHNEAIRRVIEVMHKEYNRRLTVQELADCAQYSLYHFERIFQKETGISPGQFLASIRIEKAKHLLLKTTLNISDISSQIGYVSLATFSRRFKAYVGLNPSQFRKSLNQVLPDLDKLRIISDNPLNDRKREVGIQGEIFGPPDFKGIILIGLFPSLESKGEPLACTILRKPGFYAIRELDVPDGEYYLISAAFHWSRNPLYYLLSNHVLRSTNEGKISIKGGKAFGNTSLILREALQTDPPISISVPYLIHRTLNRYHS
ncbi:helix-turn-helix domain-containing protein [Kroppenstedtia guangzhouensis]|uniref:helix-turn-helix domain-containing protein n=1 Tax=Kroppenstedtia guangzhouensis TaxID=1274356 RepID=UPI00166AC305|nr:helix-turn-helix transcriptional regulator [Kroppenstedtia guangzhouensis]